MREMKDSGVEWIGKIPKDWEIVPLTKQLDSIVDYRGKTPEKTEEGTFLVTAKNIKDGKICYELSKEYVREADYEEIMHRGIPQIGDILFTTEAPLGQVANVDRTDIALAQRIIKFRALSTVNNYYLKYWMLNEGFQQFLHSLSTGSTATGIKSSKLFLLPLVRPNIEQQNKIVEYLDAKCSKIDEIVEKQKVIIEKLEEYKLSIITEAVTSGINPDVEMKDSGSVWFGNIPINWEMKRLKYVFHIQKDIAGEEGHTVLSITQRGIIPKDFSNNEGQFANSYANYQLVHKGDFAMNHMDLLTGWVDISKYEGVTSPDYRVFVLNDKNGMCPKYYLYMMQMCYTTLQKFPVIYKEVDSAKKRFAIIIDEAHSSQTGDAAKKLKRALADTEEILKEYAEMEDEDERNRKDDEDKLLDELAAQGMHKNLSFFAFTATPKGKTLQLFGQKDAEGIYRPFHIYSMRQAIEEHFILDVLQNYMTYKMYYKIAKIIEDNPEFDTTAGSKAIINYETLHPHNISQKTAIMLEHFMNVTRHKIGGRAKAMVVTPSRLHAVRYVQEFKRQIKEKGLNDLEVLVAFSGEVKDNDDVFTEEGMNKDKEGKTIKEKALPETFHADDYGILVVAEKYQTGFDEPLLHTMFVDKKLSGVKAVQTLSRLNRTTRGKVDTFVLDFVNSAEDIKASFEPFYEETVLLEETDPNVVYDMKNTLDDFRVYQKSEVDKFADIFYQNENQSAGDLGKLQGQLRPAIDRYEVLEVEKQDIFKSTLASFNRVYAYITQVCRLFDKDIHRFSIYSKFLYTMLPKGHGGEKINIDDKVLLEYYKLEKDFEGPIELESTEGGYTPISGDSGHREPKKDPLTVIIDKINEKYGTHFTEMDKVLVQMENDYANQEKWQSYAKNNDRATFMLLFEKDFPNMAADRYEQNDQFFRKLFDDPDMMRQVMETVGSVLYERLKKKYIFDPKSGVIEEATPETYVEDTYLTKK